MVCNSGINLVFRLDFTILSRNESGSRISSIASVKELARALTANVDKAQLAVDQHQPLPPPPK